MQSIYTLSWQPVLSFQSEHYVRADGSFSQFHFKDILERMTISCNTWSKSRWLYAPWEFCGLTTFSSYLPYITSDKLQALAAAYPDDITLGSPFNTGTANALTSVSAFRDVCVS